MGRRDFVARPVEAFGPKLAEMRVAKGWSQPVLARKLGCSRGFIAHMEHGKNPPDLDQFVEICAVFGVTPSSFLADILFQEALTRQGK